MQNLADFKWPFKFDTTTIKYDFQTGSWSGYYFDTATSAYIQKFDATSALSSTWQGYFSSAMSAWDQYSVFNISNASVNSNVHIYAGNNLNYGSSANTGYFDGASDILATFPTDGNYTRSEIAVDVTSSTLGTAQSAYWGALHESGHVLGLTDIGNNANYNTDMTVMSYNIANGTRYAVTPMAYDIAALEDIYGANAIATGNNTYGSSWFAGTNRALTIQDTSGTDTFDLSSISGDHKINLNEAIDGSNQWTNSETIVNGLEYVYIAQGTHIENATGGAGNDTIYGNALANQITGGIGANTLYGGAGNDTFILTGTNTIDGGADTDTLDYSSASAVVWVNMQTGVTTNFGAMATLDTFSNIERVIGSNFGDNITGSASATYLDGGAGNDVIASYGHSTVNGGTGTADTYVAGGVAAYVDITNGQSYDYTGGVIGALKDTFSNFERYSGWTADDYFLGSSSGDNIQAGSGADTVFAGNGNDSVGGGVGNDSLVGDAGNDTLDGSDDNDFLYGGDDTDSLNGGNGNDFIDGGSGTDVLNGGAGNDTLYGGNADTAGAGGVDTFNGGTGDDIFLFPHNGNTYITDFEGEGSAGGDRIEVGMWLDGVAVDDVSELFIAYGASTATIDWWGDGSAITVVNGVTSAFSNADFIFHT